MNVHTSFKAAKHHTVEREMQAQIEKLQRQENVRVIKHAHMFGFLDAASPAREVDNAEAIERIEAVPR